MTDITNNKVIRLSTNLIRVTTPDVQTISDNSFLSYVALMQEGLKSQLISQPVFVANMTQLAFNIEPDPEKVDYNKIKLMHEGFKELVEKTNIKCKPTQFNSFYYIKTDSLDIDNIVSSDNSYYVPLSIDDVQKICSSKYSFKKRLLRYYCCLLSLIVGKKEKIAFVTLGTASQLSGYSQSSCVKYNKALEELELLSFYDKHLAKGSEYYEGNVFSTWKYRYLVKEYVAKHYPECNQIPKKTVSERKSLKMKYYEMLKGRRYDKETTKKIKEYICNSNKYNQEIIDDLNSTEAQVERAEKSLLDESIFERL